MTLTWNGGGTGGVDDDEDFNPYDLIPEFYGNHSGNRSNDLLDYARDADFLEATSELGELISDSEFEQLLDLRPPIDDLDRAAAIHDRIAINVSAQYDGLQAGLGHIGNDLNFSFSSFAAGIDQFFGDILSGNVFGAFQSLGVGLAHSLFGIAAAGFHAVAGIGESIMMMLSDVSSGIGNLIGDVGGAIGSLFGGLFGSSDAGSSSQDEQSTHFYQLRDQLLQQQNELELASWSTDMTSSFDDAFNTSFDNTLTDYGMG